MQGFVITNGIKYIIKITLSMFNGHHSFSYSNSFLDSAFAYEEFEFYKNNIRLFKTLNFPEGFCLVELTDEQLQEVQNYRDLKEIIE